MGILVRSFTGRIAGCPYWPPVSRNTLMVFTLSASTTTLEGEGTSLPFASALRRQWPVHYNVIRVANIANIYRSPQKTVGSSSSSFPPELKQGWHSIDYMWVAAVVVAVVRIHRIRHHLPVPVNRPDVTPSTWVEVCHMRCTNTTA